MKHLFDVVIAAYGEPTTGEHRMDVTVIDRYKDVGEVVGEQHGFQELGDAVRYSQLVVTAFMASTEA